MKHGIENIDAESTAKKKPKLEKKLPELLQEIREGYTENFRHFLGEIPIQSLYSEAGELIINDLRQSNPNTLKETVSLELINEKLDEQTALSMTQILNDSKVNRITFNNNYLNKETIATIINTLKNNPKNESLSFQNIKFDVDTANVIATALKGTKIIHLAFFNNILGDEKAITIASAIKEELHVKLLEFRNNNLSAQGILSILDILQGSSITMLSLAQNNLIAKEGINVNDYTKILTEVLKNNIRHLDLYGCIVDEDSLNAWGIALKQSSIKTLRSPAIKTDKERINFVKNLVDSPIIALDVGIITDYHLKQLFAPLKESKIIHLWFHGHDISEETINELNSILSINRLKSERANAMLSSFYLSKLERAEPLVTENQNQANVTQTASIPKMGT